MPIVHEREQMYTEEPIAASKFRLEGRTLSLIEEWRRAQPRIPSRTEAIRQLIEKAIDPAASEGKAA
jgi:hypothetical protein